MANAINLILFREHMGSVVPGTKPSPSIEKGNQNLETEEGLWTGGFPGSMEHGGAEFY